MIAGDADGPTWWACLDPACRVGIGWSYHHLLTTPWHKWHLGGAVTLYSLCFWEPGIRNPQMVQLYKPLINSYWWSTNEPFKPSLPKHVQTVGKWSVAWRESPAVLRWFSCALGEATLFWSLRWEGSLHHHEPGGRCWIKNGVTASVGAGNIWNIFGEYLKSS